MAFTYQGTSGGGGPAIETYVETVNGESGIVTLNANDVGAAAENHLHEITDINNYTEGYDFYIRKTSDTSRASTTTFADDPDLSGIFLSANSVYCMEAWLDLQAASTPGSKIILGGPAGCAARVFYTLVYDGASAPLHYHRQSMLSSGENLNGLVDPIIFMRMVIRNGATEGDFAIRWAQHTSDVTATVMRKGSFIRGKFF